MKDENGNYDGMPAGWKPKCLSKESMQFLNDFDGADKN